MSENVQHGWTTYKDENPKEFETKPLMTIMKNFLIRCGHRYDYIELESFAKERLSEYAEIVREYAVQRKRNELIRIWIEE